METLELLMERIQSINSGFSQAHQVKIQTEFNFCYPPVLNDEALTEKIHHAFADFKTQPAEPSAGAEDFSFYQQDEEVLGVGVAAFISIAEHLEVFE